MRKLKKYKPTKFKAKTSTYNKELADYAVAFIESLCHTKGTWAGHPFELIDWQEQIIRDLFGTVKPNGYRQFNTAYIEIPKKQGKQLALDTPIPTPDGWKTMGELTVGDRVFDETGTPCHIVAKSAVDDTEQAYRLTFRDGSSIVAGERHLWDVEYIHGKRKKKEWTTGEIYKKVRAYRERFTGTPEARRSLIRIPVASPLQTLPAQFPLDPYLYGYWLGNGCANKPCITIRTEDVEEVLSHIPYETHNRYPQKCGGSDVVYFDELRDILVPTFRDKRIRPEYLRASEAQRWRLLQGLVDSDGSIGDRKAQSTYTSTIRQLALDVRELLWSLGIKNAMTEGPSLRYGKPTGETLYVIRFTSFSDQPTSQLKRKSSRKRERELTPNC